MVLIIWRHDNIYNDFVHEYYVLDDINPGIISNIHRMMRERLPFAQLANVAVLKTFWAYDRKAGE